MESLISDFCILWIGSIGSSPLTLIKSLISDSFRHDETEKRLLNSKSLLINLFLDDSVFAGDRFFVCKTYMSLQ